MQEELRWEAGQQQEQQLEEEEWWEGDGIVKTCQGAEEVEQQEEG